MDGKLIAVLGLGCFDYFMVRVSSDPVIHGSGPPVCLPGLKQNKTKKRWVTSLVKLTGLLFATLARMF